MGSPGGHRIHGANSPKLPVHRATGPLRRLEHLRSHLIHTVSCPDIHHPTPAVSKTHEEVGSVAPQALSVVPVQPERLRRDPSHLRITVQKDQPIPFQPRLVANVLARRRAEVPARKALSALGPAERTHRRPLLETHVPAGRQRPPNLYAIF